MCFSIHVDGIQPVSIASRGLVCRQSYYFEARRSSNLVCSSTTTVSYDVLDETGNKGMNISTGIFTAPENGVYVFNFHGLRNTLASKPQDYATRVLFRVNGYTRAVSYAESNSPVGLSSILTLTVGDKVGVWCNLGVLYGFASETFTIFSSYMIPKSCE